MKKLRLKNIIQEVFTDALRSFKEFVNSDFEFNQKTNELVTYKDTFDKTQLIELATFYGSSLFIYKNEIKLLQHQQCEIEFEKDYKSPKVIFKTDWDDEIEIKPIIMFDADSFLTKKIVNILSVDSQKKLIENVPTFNIEQSVYRITEDSKTYDHFAYRIIKNTLIFIRDEEKKGIITNLWKIQWNEKKV